MKKTQEALQKEDNTKEKVLYIAFELSNTKWKLSLPVGKTPWPIPSRLSTSLVVTPGSEAICTTSNLNSRSYALAIDTPPVPFYNFALRCVH